jgi:predicted GNAT family acetyltransferase
LLMKQVLAYVQESGKKVWPLDPVAIKYFEKHPELNDIWYHRPFTK